jgi:hypothetical protein
VKRGESSQYYEYNITIVLTIQTLCAAEPRHHSTAASEEQKQQSVSPAPSLEDSVKAESVNPSVCNVMLSSYGPKGSSIPYTQTVTIAVHERADGVS